MTPSGWTLDEWKMTLSEVQQEIMRQREICPIARAVHKLVADKCREVEDEYRQPTRANR